MRIISGKYKGRVLTSFQADNIRPTMDRVKETLFNKWMGYVEEASVLDLFSGTGNLGIEALSRGCKHVDFVEMNVKSIQIIKKNVDMLKLSNNEYKIHKADVLQYLKRYQGPTYNLILIDPPFTEKMAHDVMQALDASQCYDENTLIAIESIKKERMDEAYTNLYRYDFNDYGDKVLSFFAKKAQD
ncbi:16S rRNA (guanine(966)-N(2))-methyltransferase RsmD [bacterium]|nr:16S rRNA (guanine(966)-N(2))-methyltransferase RsmD [bacterium]